MAESGMARYGKTELRTFLKEHFLELAVSYKHKLWDYSAKLRKVKQVSPAICEVYVHDESSTANTKTLILSLKKAKIAVLPRFCGFKSTNSQTRKY